MRRAKTDKLTEKDVHAFSVFSKEGGRESLLQRQILPFKRKTFFFFSSLSPTKKKIVTDKTPSVVRHPPHCSNGMPQRTNQTMGETTDHLAAGVVREGRVHRKWAVLSSVLPPLALME